MKKTTWTRVLFVLDIICILSFVLAIILFAAVGKPYKRGFFCNDESIKKPYKDSTVSTAMAIAVGAAISLVVIVVTELLLNHQRCGKVFASDQQQNSSGCCLKVPPVIKMILWVTFVDMYGAAMNTCITDVGKYTLGRLRPHFLDVCKPDWSKVNCTDPRGNFVFVVDDVCTGTNARLNKEMRLSFPSGHASFAAYITVFLALYIEAKVLLPSESKFLKPLIQAIVILGGLYTGFSRVSDYKHHWSDVLGGFSLGTIIAFITFFRILKPRFVQKQLLVEHDNQNSEANADNAMIHNNRRGVADVV